MKHGPTAGIKHALYWKLYIASHNNAIDLSTEAELLFAHGRYARAFTLAFTALEEIAKSQLAADVYTGFIEEEEFQKFYRDHKAKIGRMQWASIEAQQYLVSYDSDGATPTFPVRNDSLYVGLKDGQVIVPSEAIGRGDAEAIIQTVDVALRRIWYATEYMGHQIGTKGFMK